MTIKPKSISVALISLALVCVSQTSAGAHYDLQDYQVHKSAHSHSSQHKHGAHTAKKSGNKQSAVNTNDHSTNWTKTTEKNKPSHAVASPSVKTHSLFDPWKLFELAMNPAYAFTGRVSITVQGPFRVIRSNGLPDHQTGAFPNEGNPNTISEQNYEYRVPKDPKVTGQTTPLDMSPFGVAINGVPFDPGAAEWYNGNPRSGWQYEAMYLGARLGIDQNNAHVQPNGAYHYHGIPTGLMQKLAAHGKPVFIGYAADGFPIYGPFDYSDPKNKNSGLKKLKSSYRLKSGTRPSSPGPGGRYDGAFTEDYEYAKGLGDLDESNGRFGITPEYPQGIYHYIVSDQFPFIPRSFKGTPDDSFKRRRPGGGPRPGGATTPNSGANGQRRNTPWGRAPGDEDEGPDRGGPPQGGPPRRDGPPERDSSPGGWPPPPPGMRDGPGQQGPRGGPPEGHRPPGQNGDDGPPPFGPPGVPPGTGSAPPLE